MCGSGATMTTAGKNADIIYEVASFRHESNN
jgi:hypothetical protein